MIDELLAEDGYPSATRLPDPIQSRATAESEDESEESSDEESDSNENDNKAAPKPRVSTHVKYE